MSCTDNAFMHKHHIIPRYKGGSDEPENLVTIPVIRHAMYHFCNYQLWGNEEDRIAWRGLSGIISNEQVIYESILLGQSKGVKAAKTPEAIEKKKKKLKEIKHQQGSKNSQYGKKWIHNLKLKQSMRIDKNSEIPEGWKLGRIINFDSHIQKLKRKENNKLKSENEINNKIAYYEKMYKLYLTKGFSYIRDELKYNKTRESLIVQFKKYVKSYVPYEKTRVCKGK